MQSIAKVEVQQFPKPCPVCRRPLVVVRKLSGAWWWKCSQCGEVPRLGELTDPDRHVW